MAFHVWDNWSAVPETDIRTPGGRPCSSSAAITSVSSRSTAASRGSASDGRTSSVMVRKRSRCRISVGPAVTRTSANSETGTIRPVGVTTGKLPTSCVRRPLRIVVSPLSVRSSRRLPTLISATRKPSLNASTVAARSCVVSPASARRTRSGINRTSGAPSSRPGIGRN